MHQVSPQWPLSLDLQADYAHNSLQGQERGQEWKQCSYTFRHLISVSAWGKAYSPTY